MSPKNIPPLPENQDTNTKTTPQKSPQEPPLKCPRCDSSNTKFCYYNNYNLTQPRHFCKTCRRYWTRGGALRSVPIGGGCRKTKKLKTTSSKLVSPQGGGDGFGLGFKFPTQNLGNLNPGLNTLTEFNLGGFPLPRLHPATAGVFTQFVTSSVPTLTPECGHRTNDGPYFGLDLAGLNYSLQSSSPPCTLVQNNNTVGNQHQISIASIESLSSINQEMHWKLQQQRLSAMIYEPSLQDVEGYKTGDQEKVHQGEINELKNSEINSNYSSASIARKIDVGPTEWLFDQIQSSCSSDNNYF